jgi:hypothetical protein
VHMVMVYAVQSSGEDMNYIYSLRSTAFSTPLRMTELDHNHAKAIPPSPISIKKTPGL